MQGVGTLLHFREKNSCIKLQKGTWVKLTQEYLTYLPCSNLESKISSISVTLDSARKWQKPLGHLNQADVVRNAPETMGELDDVCNVCAFVKITKTPAPRLAETQAEQKLERLFTDVMVPFRVETKLSISKLSNLCCTVFIRNRDRDVSKIEPKALEGKFAGYAEGGNRYLVYVPNTRKVVAVRDSIIKESELGSIPDNTEMRDLLDEGSPQLGIWPTDDGHQFDGNKGKQGKSTAIKEEWHDA